MKFSIDFNRNLKQIFTPYPVKTWVTNFKFGAKFEFSFVNLFLKLCKKWTKICANLKTNWSAMYATQPLKPLFDEILEISKFQASLFTTAILAPLLVTRKVYGYVLQRFSIKKIIIISFFSFGILKLIFSVRQSYFSLLSVRVAQGPLAS